MGSEAQSSSTRLGTILVIHYGYYDIRNKGIAYQVSIAGSKAWTSSTRLETILVIDSRFYDLRMKGRAFQTNTADSKAWNSSTRLGSILVVTLHSYATSHAIGLKVDTVKHVRRQDLELKLYVRIIPYLGPLLDSKESSRV